MSHKASIDFFKKEIEKQKNENDFLLLVDIISPNFKFGNQLQIEDLKIENDTIHISNGDFDYIEVDLSQIDKINMEDFCTHKVWELILRNSECIISFSI